MKSIYVSCWVSLEEVAVGKVEALLPTNWGGWHSCRHIRCPTLAAVAVFVVAEDEQT